MLLTDKAVRSAKPKDKSYRLRDGDGLFLQVQPSGSKYWRLRYFYLGKEKMLALGVFKNRRYEAEILKVKGAHPFFTINT